MVGLSAEHLTVNKPSVHMTAVTIGEAAGIYTLPVVACWCGATYIHIHITGLHCHCVFPASLLYVSRRHEVAQKFEVLVVVHVIAQGAAQRTHTA